MDRKKRRPSSTSSESDDLALVKAAAWAWYQHGSGGPDPRPPPPESDVSSLSSQRPSRPSRYQIEARSAAAAAASGGGNTSPSAAVSLLDLYEIEWITKELERLIAASSKGRADRRKEAPSSSGEGKRSGKKSGNNGGFFGRHAVAICGSVGQTVDPAAVVGRRRAKPEEVV